MALAAIGGAIGGQAMSTASAYFLQKDAQKHQLNVMKNQKQWLYDDLRAAGINPILAAGAGQVTGGTSSAAPGPGADLGAAGRAGGMYKALKEKALADAGTARFTEQLTRRMMDRAGYENVEAQIRARYNASTGGKKDILDQIKNERMLGPFAGHNMWSLGASGIKALTDKKGFWDNVDLSGSGTGKGVMDSLRNLHKGKFYSPMER